MPWITKEGRTVEEAQEAAIAEAGLPATDLDIEVVNAGAKGLFCLGGEPAVVRVRPKDEAAAADFRHAFRDDITPSSDDAPVRVEERVVPEPVREEREERYEDEEPAHVDPVVEVVDDVIDDEEEKRPLSERQEEAAQLGVEIVRGILERMEIEGEIQTRIAGGTVYIEVFGEEMGILIGRSGTTLEALQELVRAGIQRRLKTRQAVVVDVESYWERRRKPRSEEGGGGQRRRNGGNRRGGNRRRREPRGGPRELREPRDEPDGNR